MKILVTVKEVATVEDDFEIAGTQIDDRYLGADLNEWDDYAIEEAVQLKEDGVADEVVTVSIGPEDSEQTIRQALAKGADRAIRIWDDSLASVDLLEVAAKTEILQSVVAEEDPDLVLTGVQAGDDSFAATGVSLADAIDFQWAAVVNGLELGAGDDVAQVNRELEGGLEEATEIDLPAVLTIQTGINEPRYASLRGIRQAQQKELTVQSLEELGVDPGIVEGRLTLTDMYEPETESDVTVFEGGADETATELADLLRDRGGTMSDVLAVTEHRQGELRGVSSEIITAGRELADAAGGDLHLLVIGGDVDAFADEVNREGVDAIHTVADGEEFNHDIYVQAITQAFDALGPSYVLTPHSVNGLDSAPAVANRLGLPIVTDAIGLDIEGDTLVTTREMYGSKVETTVEVSGEQAVVSIRDAEWPPTEAAGDASIEELDVTIDEAAIGSTVTGFNEVAGGDVDISEAEVLVSVGRGIEEEDNIPLIEELAEALDATVSASRPIVDNGWLPKNRQVGQSGKVVTPEVYIAIGISGAVQHVAGMKGSETIVAINTDPNAPIMDIADYAIFDDLFDVVPALTEQFS